MTQSAFRSIPLSLMALDGHLLNFGSRLQLTGWRRFVVEFLYFGLKEARACLFVALFFTALFVVPRSGLAFTIVANLKHIKERIHVPP